MLWQDDESKLLDPNKLKEDELGLPGVPALAPSSSNIVGAGAGAIGGPAAAGGSSNGWTNIQSYIAANNKDTGSSQRLQSSVQPAFAAEKTGIDTDADKFKSAEKNTFDSLNIDPNQMSGIVDDQRVAAVRPRFAIPRPGATNYDDNVSRVRNYLTSQWQPNTTWNRTLSDNTQRIGTSLQNEGAFKKYLGDLDEQVVGSPLTSGQRALQTQFNSTNPELRETRANLLKDFAGLGEHMGAKQKEVAGYAEGLGKTFRENQTANRDYLSNLGTKAEQDQALAEANARDAFHQDYTKGMSGLAEFRPKGHGQPIPGMGLNFIFDPIVKDQTWEQLDNHIKQRGSGALPMDVDRGRAALEDFLRSENLKYANTGNDQKRDWNIVADFLGLAEPRKTRGTFSVRG